MALFGPEVFCFGVHGVLREHLVHTGTVVDEHAYAQGCVQGGATSRADTLYPGETMMAGQRLGSQNGRHAVETQGDGNLVLYTPIQTPIWASHTAGNPNAYLAIQDDCNLVIYRPEGTPVWPSGTMGCG